MNKNIIKYATGRDIEIKVKFTPFTFTKEFAKLENTFDGFFATFIFTLGLTFIPTSLIAYIVKEKEFNIKH